MLLSNVEYVTLRIIRRFLLRDSVLALSRKLMPRFMASQNELTPVPIADKYWEYCSACGVSPSGKSILEIGTGATNSTGYEITGRGAGSYWAYEPFAKFNRRLDDVLYDNTRKSYPCLAKEKVNRITSLESLPDKSIDLVFSHSVLEHVSVLDELITGLARILKDDGSMIHVVDYRDHFFKYPFHFLQFSRKTWDTFLNPGDLPRYRVTDHINAFTRLDFSVELVYTQADAAGYEKVEKKIHTDFKNYSREHMAVTSAVLFVKRLRPPGTVAGQ